MGSDDTVELVPVSIAELLGEVAVSVIWMSERRCISTVGLLELLIELGHKFFIEVLSSGLTHIEHDDLVEENGEHDCQNEQSRVKLVCVYSSHSKRL